VRMRLRQCMICRTCCRAHWEADAGKRAVGRDGVLWNPPGMPLIGCKTCGNKRCPKATDCRLECSGSNEPGQVGSIYGRPLDVGGNNTQCQP
jgi:hypothetical protein